MEVQLEEGYEDKQKVLREKRELESKLAMLSDQVSGACCGPGLGEVNLRDTKLAEVGVVGSGEPTVNMCRMGVVTTHSTPRLLSLAGLTQHFLCCCVLGWL